MLACLTLGVEALAVLPGRITLARHMGALGHSAGEIAVAGMLRDVTDVAPFVSGFILLVLAVALLVRTRRLARWLLPALGVGAFALWLTSATVAEFKIQRGVDPTWFDVEIGSRATTPGDTLLGFVTSQRHYIPALLGIAAMVGLFVVAKRRLPKWDRSNRAAVLGAFAATTGAGVGLALVPLDPHVHVFTSDRHIVGEPFVNLFGSSFGHSQENVRLGMRTLIETAQFPADRAVGGEKLVGVPHAGGPVDCHAHPFARSFPGADGIEPPRPGTTGHHELEPAAARVAMLLDRLSGELFVDRTKPVDVWQLMLESFRADDIHAIEPTAPREVAPITNGLYEAAAASAVTTSGAGVVAVRSMWQGGSRSSQGLSSYLCGLGTMPYGLSTSRDFGSIPLRCLPDVLEDASYETAFFYGGNPSFDEMDPFLRHHGITAITGKQQFPLGSPLGQEGVTDRAVYARATREIAGTDQARAHYTLIMSATNHVPYIHPEDMPPEIETRIAALQATPAFVGSKDDGDRVRTFAYADHALGELLGQLDAHGDRTLLILGADHATGDPFVWKNEKRNMQAATARIPFAIVLPAGLIASSAHPDAVRDAVRDLNEALDGKAWSQNDVPFFVLTLLSHAPGVRGLEQERRWHTFGGERTSPYFVSLKPEAKILGIDSVAEFYGENDEEESLFPPEKATFVSKPSEITTSSPSLQPVAATMQAYLNGYVAKCANEKSAAREAPRAPRERAGSVIGNREE